MRKAKYAVSSGHPLVSHVASEILNSGGNAYDAVIGASIMACGAEPILASLGGGGFFLGKDSSNNVSCLDFFAQSPLNPPSKSLNINKVPVNFGSATQDFYVGASAVATPGVIKGIFEIHRKYASMPIQEIFELPIQYIKSGISTSIAQANVFKLVEPILLSAKSTRNLFKSTSLENHVLQANDIFSNYELANFLELLSTSGDALFYEGDIAHEIAKLMKESNGSLTYDDLINYQLIWREPKRFNFNSHQIFTNPSPAIGGLYTKAILESYENILTCNLENRDHFQVVEKIFTQLYGSQHNGEHFVDDSIKSTLNEVKKIIEHKHISQNGTTHISIIDKHRQVACVTMSNGAANNTLIPNTGILLNNMLGETDVNKLAPNSWPLNQRLSSMMSPTIGIQNENPGNIIAIGSGGSNRIPSAVAQTLIEVIFKKKSLQDATVFPRLHYSDGLYLESSKEITDKYLSENKHKSIHIFDKINFYFGGVNSAQLNDGRYSSYADPRRQ